MSDLTPVTSADATLFVGVAIDAHGRAIIGLDAAALDALDDLLDGLPPAHDLIADGYSPATAAVVSDLRAAVGRLLRPSLYS